MYCVEVYIPVYCVKVYTTLYYVKVYTPVYCVIVYIPVYSVKVYIPVYCVKVYTPVYCVKVQTPVYCVKVYTVCSVMAQGNINITFSIIYSFFHLTLGKPPPKKNIFLMAVPLTLKFNLIIKKSLTIFALGT